MRGLFTSVPDIKSLFPVLLPVAVWGLLFVGVGGGSTSGAWNTGTPFSFFNGIRGVVPFAVASSTAVFVVYRVLQGYLPNGNIFGPLGLTTLYGVVGLIAAFNSPDGSVALWWSGLYLSVPIVLWGVAWSTDPLAQIRPLINATWLAVILAAGVLLVLAVIKLDFVDRILDPSQFLECRVSYWYDLTSGRIRGTGVGRYAAITGLIAISGLWQPKWRSMWAGILVISVLLLLYSGARGSFAGFGAGAALILVIHFVSSGRRTLVIGLLVTELHQSLAHELGLVLVDLATEGDGFEQCGHATGLRFRFDRGRHRPLALSDHDVLAKRMNLVSLQFRMFHRGRQADDLAVTVHLGCQFVPLLHGVAEKGLQHPDHVLVGVMFVIPENNVVSRLLLNLPVLFYNRLRLLENSTFFLLGDHFHTRGGKTCGTSR